MKKSIFFGSVFESKIFWSCRIAVFEASKIILWENLTCSDLVLVSCDAFAWVLELIFWIRERSLEFRVRVSGSEC
jgi:hypothetical protein